MHLLKFVNEEQIRLMDFGFTFGFWLLSPCRKIWVLRLQADGECRSLEWFECKIEVLIHYQLVRWFENQKKFLGLHGQSHHRKPVVGLTSLTETNHWFLTMGQSYQSMNQSTILLKCMSGYWFAFKKIKWWFFFFTWEFMLGLSHRGRFKF